MTRGNFKITRNDSSVRDAADRVGWLDAFANSLVTKEKAVSAVEVARQREHQSIVDQINSIVGNRSRHATVESVVQEMQERTGLKEYLRRVSVSTPGSYKRAQQVVDNIFSTVNIKVKDAILNFIKNKIEAHHGMIAIPAIQDEILSTFKRDGLQSQDVNNELVSKYINECLIAEKRKNPITDQFDSNLGKGTEVKDTSNADSDTSDFFKSLLVTK